MAQALLSFYIALDKLKHQILLSVFGFSYVCKHRPTCSQYCLEEMKQHGTIVGFWHGLQQLAKCW